MRKPLRNVYIQNIYVRNVYKRLTVVMAAGSLFGVAMALGTRGDFWPLLLGLGVALWNGLLLAGGAVLANAFGARRIARFCVTGIAAVMLGVLVSLTLGYRIYLEDIRAVKSYCQPLVHSIELYKNQHGHYPEQISAVTDVTEPVPYLTPEMLMYYNVGDRFLLSFVDPNRGLGFWVYDSSARQWRYTN
jgi:hypothetical protein